MENVVVVVATPPPPPLSLLPVKLLPDQQSQSPCLCTEGGRTVWSVTRWHRRRVDGSTRDRDRPPPLPGGTVDVHA